jgi:hypothetical protein
MGERLTCCLREERVVRGGVVGTVDCVSAGICKNAEGDTVRGRDGGVVHLEMPAPDDASGRVASRFCIPAFETALRPSVGDVGMGGNSDFCERSTRAISKT